MTPLLWIAVTVVVYATARVAYDRTRLAVLNPAIVSIAAIILILLAIGLARRVL